jgi:inosose dehydratase
MGHYAFGGGNPVEALRKYEDRLWHVHFKDFDPTAAGVSREANGDYFDAIKRGVFCELGKGSVDFKTIVKDLKTIGYTGWIVVEQDILPGMGNPKVCAQANRNYIKTLGL